MFWTRCLSALEHLVALLPAAPSKRMSHRRDTSLRRDNGLLMRYSNATTRVVPSFSSHIVTISWLIISFFPCRLPLSPSVPSSGWKRNFLFALAPLTPRTPLHHSKRVNLVHTFDFTGRKIGWFLSGCNITLSMFSAHCIRWSNYCDATLRFGPRL